jgi:hypothetical protein
MKQLSIAALIERSSDVASKRDADELILFSASNAKILLVNSIGLEIWDFLSSPRTVKSIINAFLDDYEESEKVIEREVISFLESLISQNFLIVVTECTEDAS